MDLYINDLSFQANHIAGDNHRILSEFLDICETTQNYLIENILVPDGYLNMEIADDLSFAKSYHKIVGIEVRENKTHSRIKSLLANRFKIFNDRENKELIHWVEWNNYSSDFLRSSYDHNLPTISFKTHNDFANEQFTVKKVILDTDTNKNYSNEIVLNLSDASHFNLHKVLLQNLMLEQAKVKGKWEALKDPLRFKEKIRQYMDEINFTERFKKNEATAPADKKIKRVDANERVSLAKDIGSEIAKMNGWTQHSHLSKINNRLVFKAFNQSVYLAIDTETISFELHNRYGDHQGEYNFLGEKIEEPKGHKLKLN